MFSCVATLPAFLLFALPSLGSAIGPFGGVGVSGGVSGSVGGSTGGIGGSVAGNAGVGVVRTRSIIQCYNGALFCCNALESIDSNIVTGLLSPLHLVIGSIAGPVELACSMITTTLGLSDDSCSGEVVCCTGNRNGGGGLSNLVSGCGFIDFGP